MKNLLIVACIIFGAATISGCCKGYTCPVPSHVLVAFHNYEPGELDTLYLTRYYINSNNEYGPEFIDSTGVYDDQYYVYPVEDKNMRYYLLTAYDDWQMRIPATNETYKIGSYIFEKKNCGSRTCPTNTKELTGFNVNGKTYQGPVLHLYK